MSAWFSFFFFFLLTAGTSPVAFQASLFHIPVPNSSSGALLPLRCETRLTERGVLGTNSSSAQASQLSSGVSRVAAARKRVSSKNNSASGSAPATARPRAHAAAANQGILKFYTEDAPGLRVGPQAVLIMALVFMGVVVMLHIVGKIRQSMGSS
ncbi:hypothetical protein Emed_006194 [Eimeria media]